MQEKLDHIAEISIHSLVKRETLNDAQNHSERIYFNPLPRKEGDIAEIQAFWTKIIFQSTPS